MLYLGFVFLPVVIFGVSCIVGYKASSVASWNLKRRGLSPEEIESIDKLKFCRFFGCRIIVYTLISYAYWSALYLQGITTFALVMGAIIILFAFAYEFYLKKFILRGNHFRKDKSQPTNM